MPKRKTYIIRGLLFCQEELTFPEGQKIRSILGDLFEVMQDPTKTWGEVLQVLTNEQTLPELVTLVLKPYQPTRLHRAWNRWQAMRLKFVGGEAHIHQAFPLMGLSQHAEVVQDFLALNARWMGILPDWRKKSVSVQPTQETAIS